MSMKILNDLFATFLLALQNQKFDNCLFWLKNQIKAHFFVKLEYLKFICASFYSTILLFSDHFDWWICWLFFAKIYHFIKWYKSGNFCSSIVYPFLP